MRISLLSITAAIAVSFSVKVNAHTVQFAHCMRCCQVILYAEHWHGTQSPPAPLSLQITINGQTTTDTIDAVMQYIDVPLAQLPCSDSVGVISACPNQANTYDDWWEYRIPGINCGDTVTITVVAGLNTAAQDGCSALPATSISFIACANSKPHPAINAPDTVCQNASVSFNDATTQSFSGLANWQWDVLDNQVINYTTQNMSHTFAGTGTFPVQLIVQDNYGCIDSVTHTITVENCTGLEDISYTAMDIFPLPADDHIIVSTGVNSAPSMELQVLTLDGRLVLQTNLNKGTNRINVQTLSQGYYLMNIRNRGTILQSEKLIISR